MAPEHGDDEHYHPQDAIHAGLKSGLTTGFAGLFYASVQNALSKRNIGPWAVFSQGGTLIATWTAVGVVYEFSRIASANLREKDDHYNQVIGGFLGGAIMGIPSGRMPRVMGAGAGTAAVMAIFSYTGNQLGPRRSHELDEYERKEKMRLNRRRPLSETVAELGEGRGIRPPGYEERRRARLKDKYGFEVQPVSADPNAA